MSVRIQNVDEKEVYVNDVLQGTPVVIYFTGLKQVSLVVMYIHVC